MITIKRSRTIQASPEVIFAVLADPERLATILPRIQRVETLERHADHARLATYMSIGHGLGDIRCEGDLHWRSPEWIRFVATKPLTVENNWSLTTTTNGTEVSVTMSLDLAPLLGPFAMFVPTVVITDMLSQDLETTLSQIARSVAPLPNDRAVAV